MAEEMSEMKTIRVLPFSGEADDWYEWLEKFKAMAMQSGYLEVMMGDKLVPAHDEDLDAQEERGDPPVLHDVYTDDEKEELHHASKMNTKGYRDLQLATTKLAFDLVALAKTDELPEGCLHTAWECLKEEYDPSEGDDKIKLLTNFQENKLEDARVNVTEWQCRGKQELGKETRPGRNGCDL